MKNYVVLFQHADGTAQTIELGELQNSTVALKTAQEKFVDSDALLIQVFCRVGVVTPSWRRTAEEKLLSTAHLFK